MNNDSKRRVLFISGELIGADIAHKLVKEGYDVKLYIENIPDRECFNGLVEKTTDWRSELEWVGKNGLIVFDDVGFGNEQDRLRKEGYLVVGGSGEGDLLELNREYGQKVLFDCGVSKGKGFETIPLTIAESIKYILEEKGAWVVKQGDHNTSLTYVGEMEDGKDVLSVLEGYQRTLGSDYQISIQKKVSGIEIAVGRFFNGNDWVGPIVINKEHKHFMNGDIGPLGGESGTLMWYEDDENNRLFTETLGKLKSHLSQSSYKGFIDINCIILNERELYPLEITSRFGSATNQTQSEIHKNAWGELLFALAEGSSYILPFQKGYAINVALTVPPFPYRINENEISQKGVRIFFKEELTPEDMKHIHFEEVAFEKDVLGNESYIIAGSSGYVLYITGIDTTINDARTKVYERIKKIHIPKMFYRTDIGIRFDQTDSIQLKSWGWI